MPAENLRGRPEQHNPSYEITPDVPFKPYAGVRRFFWPKKGETPFKVPERYEHTLLLRRTVTYQGITGYINIISDDPDVPAEILVGRFPVSKPFGEIAFVMDYRGPGDITYREQPYIIRFGFPLRTPAEYSKLLNSYVDVELGKKKYMAAWNLSIPVVARRMQRLENGEDIVVVEKNLFDLDAVPEGEEVGEQEFRRITFVWLQEDIRKLRTIKLTFHQIFDNESEEETPIQPVLIERERLLVRT